MFFLVEWKEFQINMTPETPVAGNGVAAPPPAPIPASPKPAPVNSSHTPRGQQQQQKSEKPQQQQKPQQDKQNQPSQEKQEAPPAQPKQQQRDNQKQHHQQQQQQNQQKEHPTPQKQPTPQPAQPPQQPQQQQKSGNSRYAHQNSTGSNWSINSAGNEGGGRRFSDNGNHSNTGSLRRNHHNRGNNASTPFEKSKILALPVHPCFVSITLTNDLPFSPCRRSAMEARCSCQEEFTE